MEFSVATKRKAELIDITEKVRAAAEQKVQDGICLVFVPHVTAGLLLNEHEPNLQQDLLALFKRLAPEGNYAHNKIDDNAEAHLLSSLFSPTLSLPIEEGRLVLGTWQRILLCEFDGPRTRRVIIKVK